MLSTLNYLFTETNALGSIQRYWDFSRWARLELYVPQTTRRGNLQVPDRNNNTGWSKENLQKHILKSYSDKSWEGINFDLFMCCCSVAKFCLTVYSHETNIQILPRREKPFAVGCCQELYSQWWFYESFPNTWHFYSWNKWSNAPIQVLGPGSFCEEVYQLGLEGTVGRMQAMNKWRRSIISDQRVSK